MSSPIKNPEEKSSSEKEILSIPYSRENVVVDKSRFLPNPWIQIFPQTGSGTDTRIKTGSEPEIRVENENLDHYVQNLNPQILLESFSTMALQSILRTIPILANIDVSDQSPYIYNGALGIAFALFTFSHNVDDIQEIHFTRNNENTNQGGKFVTLAKKLNTFVIPKLIGFVEKYNASMIKHCRYSFLNGISGLYTFKYVFQDFVNPKNISFDPLIKTPTETKVVSDNDGDVMTSEDNFSQYPSQTHKSQFSNQSFPFERLISIGNFVIAQSKDSAQEVLYGTSGYLWSWLYLYSTHKISSFPLPHIRKILDHIWKSSSCIDSQEMKCCVDSQIVNFEEDDIPIWKWHGKQYLGAGHGSVGIIYSLLSLLRFSIESKQKILTLDEIDRIRRVLGFLYSLQFPSGNLPSSTTSMQSDKLVQWCHGAPGLLLLACKAHQIWPDEDVHYQVALKASSCIWSRGILRKSYSICHGTSGSALSLLLFSTVFGLPEWETRARLLASLVINQIYTPLRRPDTLYSLYEGMAGAALYLPLQFILSGQRRTFFPGFWLR